MIHEMGVRLRGVPIGILSLEVVPGVVESRHTLAPDRFRCRDASPPADPAPSSPRSATIVRLV